MAAPIEDWNIDKLLAGRYTTQEKATAAHVAPSRKFCGEEQPVPENLQQRIDVFGSRNTPKQNHLTRITGYLAKLLAVATERNQIALVARVDISAGDLAQAIESQNRRR